MTRLRPSLLAFVLAGGSILAACGDDVTSSPTGPGLDTLFPDAGGDTLSGPEIQAPGVVRKLEFETPNGFGDDQVACLNQARCTVSLSFTERRTIKVKYTEDGQPVAGQTVNFEIPAGSDRDGIGFISAMSAATGADGIASIETRAREGRVGQFAVRAWIDGLPERFFDVVVTPKGQVPLTVIGTYSGTRAVGAYDVLLYSQANNAPACSTMFVFDAASGEFGYEKQTARTSRTNVLISQTAKFPEFPNLERDGQQKYTVIALAKNQRGTVIAWGCNDKDALVKWTSPTSVTVPLVDRPPLYAGTYEITSYFDFVSAIPEPYQSYVRAVIDIFDNPLDGLINLVCTIIVDAQDGQTNDFCDAVAGDGAVANAVKDILNQILMGFLPPNVQQIFQTGADVGKLLEKFEVTEVLTIASEPDAFGKFAAGAISHVWGGMRFRWRLNQGCAPDSTTCGVTQLSFSQLGVDGIRGAAAGEAIDTWNLRIDKHSVNLKYGLLLSAMLEKVVFPLVTSTNDSNNPVDSYEELLGMLFGGGTECLTASVTCCESFATRVSTQSSLQGAARAGCDAVVQLVPTTLRSLLGGLELNSEQAFTLATKPTCAMDDVDSDMTIDSLGTNTNHCQWDAQLRFGSSTTTSVQATFYGTRQ
jgi:hypothetical protein